MAAEASLASLDAERITRDNVAKESSDGWRAALDTLEAMFDTARAAASVAHSARNQALALVSSMAPTLTLTPTLHLTRTLTLTLTLTLTRTRTLTLTRRSPSWSY